MRIDTYIYKTIYYTIMLKFDNENESKMNNIPMFYDMFENYDNT